jgi:hypothetical protein
MMFWTDIKFPYPFCLVVFMEQLMALGIEPGDKDSAARYLASLKSELADEKAAWKEAKVEVQALARVVVDKKMTDKFTVQIPELEEKVMDGLTELRTKELSLEQTTKANEDYKSQNAWLTKKLENKLSSLLPPGSCSFT